jgi:hypothetical protein
MEYAVFSPHSRFRFLRITCWLPLGLLYEFSSSFNETHF